VTAGRARLQGREKSSPRQYESKLVKVLIHMPRSAHSPQLRIWLLLAVIAVAAIVIAVVMLSGGGGGGGGGGGY
jgi:hypothetical protein